MQESESVPDLGRLCGKWFQDRGLSCAVVGYSGGVDSATTAALLHSSGIEVHLVVAEAPSQRYSSPLGGASGAKKFLSSARLDCSIHTIRYSHLFADDAAANEAAAPIQRLSCFYAISASLRARGKRAVVVGTANFDEAGYLGFWGKASDGAQDFYPISHLHKSQVVELGASLGVPEEILRATPSGDLLFTETNDFRMIGASYDEIEAIAISAEKEADDNELISLIRKVPNPQCFVSQILNNAFKYELPFGGFHLSDRLERFRIRSYPRILKAAEVFGNA